MDPHSSLISLNLDIFIAKQLVYKLKFNYVFMQFGKAQVHLSK